VNLRNPKTIMFAAFVSVCSSGAAFADCAADLTKLDSLLKGTTLTAKSKNDLDAVRLKAADLLKAHDDKGCSTMITDAIAKAGVKM